MEARPRPITGALLGLLLGLVVVGLMWQLGWLPPDRLVVFGLPALTAFGFAWLLTRDARAALGRFIGVAVVCGGLAGAALTGIPEIVRGGGTSDGCTLEVVADGRVATPDETSAWRRLVVTTDAPVEWTATTTAAFAPTEAVAAAVIGGYQIDLHTVTYDGQEEATTRTGTVDVAAGLEKIQDRTGLELSGVYHLAGRITGDTGSCAFDGYAALIPAGLFATNVLIGLWIALGVLLILLAWAAFAVRRSFRAAERERQASAPETAAASDEPGEADPGAWPAVAPAAAPIASAQGDGAAEETSAADYRPPVSPYATPAQPEAGTAAEAAPAEDAAAEPVAQDEPRPVERRSFTAPAAAAAGAAASEASDGDDAVDTDAMDETAIEDTATDEGEGEPVVEEPEGEPGAEEEPDTEADGESEAAEEDESEAGETADGEAEPADEAVATEDEAFEGPEGDTADEPGAEPGAEPEAEPEEDDRTAEIQRVRADDATAADVEAPAEPEVEVEGEGDGEQPQERTE